MGIEVDLNAYGAVIRDNHFGIKNTGNGAIGVQVESNGNSSGGNVFTITGNTIFMTAGAADTNVVGINILGVNPNVFCFANQFTPSGEWTGAGSEKISGGVGLGLQTVEDQGANSDTPVYTVNNIV